MPTAAPCAPPDAARPTRRRKAALAHPAPKPHKRISSFVHFCTYSSHEMSHVQKKAAWAGMTKEQKLDVKKECKNFNDAQEWR